MRALSLSLFFLFFSLDALAISETKKVAVLNIENIIPPEKISSSHVGLYNVDSKYDYMEQALTDMLISDLFRTEGIELLERSKLDKLLDEIGLSKTGIIDEKALKQSGKVIPADYLLYGYLEKEKDDFAIRLKVFNILSNEITELKKGIAGENNLFGLSRELLKAFADHSGIKVTIKADKVGISQNSTLAILPFCNNSRTDKFDYLQAGLAELISADLSNCNFFRIIERQRIEVILDEMELSLRGFVDEATSVAIGRLLGADYILLGSFFQVGEQIRIDARIVEVETSETVLASSVEGAAKELFQLQEGLIEKITARMGQLKTDGKKITSAPTNIFEAYVHFRKGLDYKAKVRLSPDNGEKYKEKAINEFKTALVIDPEFNEAFYELVDIEYISFWKKGMNPNFLFDFLKQTWDDETKSFVLYKLGNIYASQCNYSDAFAFYNKSLKLYSEPSLLMRSRYCQMGKIHVSAQDEETAKKYFEKSLELNEYLYKGNIISGPEYLLFKLDVYSEMIKDYGKALNLCSEFLAEYPHTADAENVSARFETYVWQCKDRSEAAEWYLKKKLQDIEKFEKAIEYKNYNPKLLSQPRYHIELMMHYFSPGIAQYEKGFEVYNEIIKKFPNVSPQYMMPFTLPTLGENIVLSAFKKLNQWDLYFQAKKGQLSNAMLDGPGTLALLSSSYAEYLSKPKESADALSLRRFIEIIRSNNQKQIYAAVIAVVFTLFISVILIPREKKSKVRIVTICLIVLSVSAAVFFAMFFYSRLLQGKAYQINRRRLTVEAAANDGLSEDVDINKWIMGIRGDQINCVSINSKLPEQNFQNKELRVGKDNIVNRGTWRALINFKIPKVQTTDFVSAKLYLYGISPDFAGFSSEEYLISPMEILEVPLAWDYMRTTWNNRMENTMWQVPGGDIIGEAIPMDDLLFDEKGKRYVYMFELADLIKEKIKNGETACGLLIKEYDEENSFPRQSSQFYGDNTSLSPKIVLVFKSESRPEIDNLIEYQYDWIDFYKVGMDALVKRDLDKTLAYWKKSAELIEDYWIKIEVQKHIDIIKKALSEEII